MMHFQHKGKLQCLFLCWWCCMFFCLFFLSSDRNASPLQSHIIDDCTVCFYRCEGAGDKMPKYSNSRFKVRLCSSWTLLKQTGPVTVNQKLWHVRGTVPYQVFHIPLYLLKVLMVNMDKATFVKLNALSCSACNNADVAMCLLDV